ncbi:MAG: transketolase [Legionellales bacterium]|mgnify:CR=1 FL=1|nr:transketolase [Legionellales bacterium]|tara:strand:- start:6757 stop:8763 length:2007 start_codon:yes stop_codon:yes gene_type:complete
MPSRQQLANAIRALSMDSVEKANSGHPGMPMGMADIAEVLWQDFLSHNPGDPDWANRDRFILSNGHGSMLLYSLLHLTGYDMGIEDLKNFRQLHSKTPGHPEYGYAPGIETTTGPLGQGLANAVGMAIAERAMAARFNKPGFELINHAIYTLVGDGCLMEGISHEVCSLAGTLGLGDLVVIYDDNGISIDGETEGWFTDNTPERFRAYGWHVIADVDGHNSDAIHQALTQAQSITDKPTLICCKTVIGYGAPNAAGGAKCHGAALGGDEITAARKQLAWEHEPFVVPDELYSAWDAREKGAQRQAAWNELFKAYGEQYPELAAEFIRRRAGQLPADWQTMADGFIQDSQAKAESIASRKASQVCLNQFGPELPELIGGSADLTGSNLTNWSGSKTFSQQTQDGNYIYYGVREFGMSAINNGIALYGGFIPYSGTFLTFCDYARNAVRMAALMKLRNIFVYTHDSIGLGEDGPTHQPIEHAAMLRLTPNMSVWRPCDTVESAVAWRHALEREEGPTSLLFSRQSLPHQDRDAKTLANVSRGGYVLREGDGTPQAIIIATGSEVALAMAAAEQLAKDNISVRVVSMPSTDIFDEQEASYQETVLPNHITARVAVEAGIADYWYKYVGLKGFVVGMRSYGESAPANDVFNHFGFTVDNIIDVTRKTIEENT